MNILVLSPHTDDIELGCGGSLTKWVEKHHIYVVAFSPCVEAIPDGWKKDSTKMEFTNSMQTLGCDFDLLEYPVRKFLNWREDILDFMAKTNKTVKPDLVIIPSQNDKHQDHKVISDEALRVFKCSVLGYESPYNNRVFEPVYYEKLKEKHLRNKIKLVNMYKSQIAKGLVYFAEDYLTGLARVRGLQIKTKYAEAFECYRYVC